MENKKQRYNLIELRKLLHQNAELSHREIVTSKIIFDYMNLNKPDKIISFDKGYAFVFDSGHPGLTTLFRADMDALPIQEKTGCKYSSNTKNTSHMCGHDGHMAILCGLADQISQNKPQKGKVILLFQPAEETGEGAELIVNNQKFKELNPDYIFGLHNIPGYNKGNILFKRNNFASASRGMIIKLTGKTSHAAEPENGINPVFAIEKMIKRLYDILECKSDFIEFVSLTIIYIKLGEIAFGTSPGYAEVMLTLRSLSNVDMKLLIQKSEDIVKKTSDEENLKSEISYKEIFPAVINDDECVDIIQRSAVQSNLETFELQQPFKWSEDFSYYTENYKGAFFGIGAGEDHSDLHNSDYDFPDDIIEIGVKMYFQIYKNIYKVK
ncbi:MAG: amidohydrolase [Candidatus Delongbacteria bacterium]|jgi:amidohydrolase|nr:amidohydrolase [Candidatus Delongbacteria bacterium]